MARGFRYEMSSLHSWVGLLLGWVLYFIFATGTIGYFDTELDRWMQPELPQSKEQTANLKETKEALNYLSQHANGAKSWSIHFAKDRNTPYLELWWQDALLEWHNQKLAPDISPLNARETGGAQVLYKMHWKFHYLPRWASDWLVGIAAMFLFLAVTTGVIIHKNILKNFFTFRRGINYRAWLDAHKLVGVIVLPFHLVIASSGLVFIMFAYFPWIISSFYGAGIENKERMFDDIFSAIQTPMASGKKAELVDFSLIWEQLEEKNLHASVSVIEVLHPNDENSQITLYVSNENSILRAPDQWVFSGVDGRLLAYKLANASLAESTRDLLLSLHEGLFADTFVRWLYFLSGLLGSAMVATGLILWTKKRKEKGSLALVERLNIATIVGLISAIGVYFVANRILALDMPQRAEWEVHLMFISWGTLFIHTFFRSVKRAWIEQLYFGATIFLSLPILSALFTQRPFWLSVTQGDILFVTIELIFILVGAVFFYLARKINQVN